MSNVHPLMQGVLDQFKTQFDNVPRDDGNAYVRRIMAQMPTNPSARDMENILFRAWMNGWTQGWKDSSRHG